MAGALSLSNQLLPHLPLHSTSQLQPKNTIRPPPPHPCPFSQPALASSPGGKPWLVARASYGGGGLGGGGGLAGEGGGGGMGRGGLNTKRSLKQAEESRGRGGMGEVNLQQLIAHLMSLPPRGTLAREMESYKNKLTMQDFSIIFREFAQKGDWQRALRLFKYMQRQRWCRPNEHIYTIMIGIMGREGLVEKALELFEEMPQQGVDWNVFSFTALINAFGRNGQYEAALDLLSRMKREGVRPNLITFNTVLNACAKGGLPWESLVRIYAQMKEEGVQPDLITFNTLLAACATRGLMEESVTVFCTMIGVDFRIDDPATPTSQQADGANGSTMDELSPTSSSLSSPSPSSSPSSSPPPTPPPASFTVAPDSLSYATLCDVFRRGRQLDSVRRLLRQMAAAGIVAEVAGYNSLIDAYGRSGQYREAGEVFEDMIAASCPPNVSTYSLLLRTFGLHGRYDEVRRLFGNMKASGINPDINSYNTLVNVFCNGGYFKEAASLFNDMVDDGLQLDAVSYEQLLLACARGGLDGMATQVYRHLDGNPDIQRTSRMYQALISAYGARADYHRALAALHDMINRRLVADTAPFDALISAYSDAALYDDAAFVYGLMVQESSADDVIADVSTAGYGRGLQATIQTFNSLIEGFGKGGLLEEAASVFGDMKEARQEPDEGSHAALVSVYFNAGVYEAALAQLLEMQEEGFPPPPTAFCNLLSLSARRGRWSDVSRTLDEMAEGLIKAGEMNTAAIFRGLVIGPQDIDSVEEALTDLFEYIKTDSLAEKQSIMNATIDALWSLQMQKSALHVLESCFHRGLFPEASVRGDITWALDVHRMLPGTCSAAVFWWIGSIRQSVQEDPSQLPNFFTIIVKWGEEDENVEELEGRPVRKAALTTLRRMNAPFSPAPWNEARLISERGTFLQWLLDPSTQDKISLSNRELQLTQPSSSWSSLPYSKMDPQRKKTPGRPRGRPRSQ